MALEKFGAGAIATIDGGRIGVAIDQAIDRARRDCFDRPGLEKPRKVTIEITILPVLGEKDLDSCNVVMAIKESIPGRESRGFNMRAGKDGLLWNELSPEDVAQTTIDPTPKLVEGKTPPTNKEAKTNAG